MRKGRILVNPKRKRFRTLRWLPTLVALVALIAIAAAILGNPFAYAALSTSQAVPQRVVSTQQAQTFPTFIHKALHWTQVVSTYTAGSHDPENGQVLTGDIWVLTGGDGLPIAIHVRYTRSDGTLVQDIVETRTSEADYFGGAYGSQVCSVGSHKVPQQQLQSALPPFIDKTSLSRDGYLQVQTRYSRAFTGKAVSSSIQPEQVYDSSTVAQSWKANETYISNMRDVKMLDLDGQNRILREEVQLFDSKNTLVQDNRHTYGSLQVYNPAMVSSATFALSTQEEGTCHA